MTPAARPPTASGREGFRRRFARITSVVADLLRAARGRRYAGASRPELLLIGQALWFGGGGPDDPLPLFDGALYLDRNPDVARSGMNPLVHFLRHGAAEGRDPHPLFSTAFYLDRNPDVARSGPNPLVHFLKRGAAEGRDPHPLFSTAFYLDRHPDVAQSGQNPLVHFVREGAAAGYDPHPLFDATFYRGAGHGEIPAEVNPLVHYLTRGAAEGRDPHPLFITEYYRSRNHDVALAALNPLVHYVRFGAGEGRWPHPLFDPAHYLRQHPPGAQPANPLVAYLEQGAAETRDPHPLFDTSFYVSRYRDSLCEGQSPLVHFVRAGAAEGLSSVADEAVGAGTTGHSEPTFAAAAASSLLPSTRVDVVALGPTSQPAREWADRMASTAAPLGIDVAGLDLPLRFPACAEAVNRVVRNSSGHYSFLATASLQPAPGWLEPLLQAFAFLPRVGAVCSSVVADAPGVGNEGASWAPAAGAVRAIEAPSAGGLLVPRELFLRVGGLDPAVSSYEEALHRLAERLRGAGFEVYGHPQSRLFGERPTPWVPEEKQRRRSLFAAVCGGPWPHAGAMQADPAVALLRLFAATGWRVVVWPRGRSGNAHESAARAWEAVGLEVASGRDDQLPLPFLEDSGADAVLLDQTIDPATVARILAVQPRARLLLLVSGDGGVADRRWLDQLDGVVSPGREPAFPNHLDLAAVLAGERRRPPTRPRRGGRGCTVRGPGRRWTLWRWSFGSACPRHRS